MRVAYYSPLPPERSGIADYSALLLPALRRHVDVAVARRRWPLLGKAEVALYHVGNDPKAHGWIVEALRRRPGVVVLHELVLHHLVAGLTLARGDAAGYVAAMERDAGAAGRRLAEEVARGLGAPPWESRPEEFPLVAEILDLATGLIVHSRYVERGARAEGFAGPIWRIPHPVWPSPQASAAELPGSPVFGAFGHVNPSKRVPQLLRAFARIRERWPQARLVLAGAVAPAFELEARVEELGLQDAVWHEDYVDEPRLWSLIAGCDAVVSLRAPTMGETSGIALRALALGKPLVVSDVGWFAELPDEVAVRVPVGEGEVETLAGALDRLAGDEAARNAMGEAASRYVRAEHDLDRVAERYAAALEWAAGGEAVTNSVVGEIAQAAAEVEIGADSPELAAIGAELRATEML